MAAQFENNAFDCSIDCARLAVLLFPLCGMQTALIRWRVLHICFASSLRARACENACSYT